MSNMTRNKWQVRLAALVIFALGCAAGALGLNAYRSWTRASERGPRRGGFEAMLDRLNLGDEQKAQVRQIMDEARAEVGVVRRETEPRFAEVRRRSDERLRQVLTPEQWQQFQQLMQETRGRRRGRKDGDRDRPPRQ